jgi:O-antigen/teichoic acid export membrane protein
MTLRAQVLASLRWMVVTRFLAQLVSWSITILVMRLLSPGDYGLLSLATIFTGLLELINEIGLSTSIVQSKSIQLQQLRQIFGAVLVTNIVACLLTAVVLAPIAAHFFAEPELAPVMQALGLAFLPVAFMIIPAALLERDMKFRGRSVVDFTAMVAAGVLVLCLAYQGFGVWALVWGYWLQVVWRAVAFNIIHPFWHLPSFLFDRSDSMFSFGRDVFVARLLWFFYVRADAFIAGKLLGKDALGLYSVSMHIASLPLERVSVVVNQIAIAAFSRVHREATDVGFHMLRSMRALSFFAFPTLWGISSVSEELIRVFLGKTWEPAAPLLGLLCFIMPLRMLGELLKSALQSVGRANNALSNTLLAAVIMPIAFYVGCQFGLKGLALAWLLIYPLVFLVNLANSAVHLKLRFLEMVSAMTRPALISAAMFGTVMLCRNYLAGTPLQNLLCLVIVGVLTYFLLSFFANREGIVEMWDLVATRSPQNDHA